MTTVYFIRHAETDYSVKDGRIRPLTEKGLADRALVTEFLRDKGIGAVLSSPFKRSVDTVSGFAGENGLKVEIIEDFREVRQRNIDTLRSVLARCRGKNIAFGTNGANLSSIINYYNNTLGYNDFAGAAFDTPLIVKMYFDANGCAGMDIIDLFNARTPESSLPAVIFSGLGTLKAYRFAVIFARAFDGAENRERWLYCRAKERGTYETAGGHIEEGETPLDAAKRELYEETGALRFDITPAFDYTVRMPDAYSHGRVFFARIHEMGEIPDFEMAETRLFDAYPEKMRFPLILPLLYDRMQAWLNIQSAKEEMWDVYDAGRNLTGRLHRRADPLAPGDFHLVVHVWLQNSRGEFLITKRAPEKGYPGMWECTGGSAVAGDDSRTAAVREVKEETGLDAAPANGKVAFTMIGEDSICDVWLFRQDFDLGGVVLHEGETVGAKYADKDEIRRMVEAGEFIAFHYIEDLFEEAI